MKLSWLRWFYADVYQQSHSFACRYNCSSNLLNYNRILIISYNRLFLSLLSSFLLSLLNNYFLPLMVVIHIVFIIVIVVVIKVLHHCCCHCSIIIPYYSSSSPLLLLSLWSLSPSQLPLSSPFNLRNSFQFVWCFSFAFLTHQLSALHY